jgi:hypothetical protein
VVGEAVRPWRDCSTNEKDEEQNSQTVVWRAEEERSNKTEFPAGDFSGVADILNIMYDRET